MKENRYLSTLRRIGAVISQPGDSKAEANGGWLSQVGKCNEHENKQVKGRATPERAVCKSDCM